MGVEPICRTLEIAPTTYYDAKSRAPSARAVSDAALIAVLVADFTATRPDEKWVADFTYCSTWSGIIYVAFVVDVFSRRIVGWKAARTMHTSLVLDALTWPPGLAVVSTSTV